MKKAISALSLMALALIGCDNSAQYTPKPYVSLKHPEFSKDAVIYELNTRHFTKEGTFKAAQSHLPRLKAMGVDIIWLMPIHPIGKLNRKGTLGSPYSVQDYQKVNPEFGTLEELKAFVDTAHNANMHVILDLVANHTAWDNVMVKAHPDWWEKDHNGNYHPTPWWDWSDIIDLDYSKPELRKYMTESMVYWVREVGIDGYRADVAGYVPLDFWENARAQMEKVKPVFMLAEWQDRDMHAKAFDATYAWDLHNAIKNVAQGKADATALYGYYSGNESAWPMEAMRMTATENHDTNAWENTQYEAFGDALPAAIALSFIGEGIPLIHNGQEACNTRRLAFFEKDEIKWQDCELAALFTKLSALKTANVALHNGQWGARMIKVENTNPKQAFSFVRQKDNNKVLGIFNFSKTNAKFKLNDNLASGTYKNYETGANVTIKADESFDLAPWSFRILTTN